MRRWRDRALVRARAPTLPRRDAETLRKASRIGRGQHGALFSRVGSACDKHSTQREPRDAALARCEFRSHLLAALPCQGYCQEERSLGAAPGVAGIEGFA
jgi:hypothetical protein